jgi:hypothetical protein
VRSWTESGVLRRLNADFYDLSNIARGMSNEEIVAAAKREIAQFAPRAAEARVQHAVMNRIPMVIPCPLPGARPVRPNDGLAGLVQQIRRRAARARAWRTPPTARRRLFP